MHLPRPAPRSPPPFGEATGVPRGSHPGRPSCGPAAPPGPSRVRGPAQRPRRPRPAALVPVSPSSEPARPGLRRRPRKGRDYLLALSRWGCSAPSRPSQQRWPGAAPRGRGGPAALRALFGFVCAAPELGREARALLREAGVPGKSAPGGRRLPAPAHRPGRAGPGPWDGACGGPKSGLSLGSAARGRRTEGRGAEVREQASAAVGGEGNHVLKPTSLARSQSLNLETSEGDMPKLPPPTPARRLFQGICWC